MLELIYKKMLARLNKVLKCCPQPLINKSKLDIVICAYILVYQ